MTWIGLLQGFGILLIVSNANVGAESTSVDVPFPPARPTVFNQGAICSQGHGRPRYPDSFFPRSGLGHFKRRGKAINRLEFWYAWCCGLQGEDREAGILCCARQAWKQALSQFCIEEYGTMTAHYECCRKYGDQRWSCFDSELSNPDYIATPGYIAPAMPYEPGFIFDPHVC
ncbi:extracellular matrix protein 1 isoform X1 [Syngnathoides biaculeatus]|uniref:extracellular matrix protein 1 isoform X1 n=1 Tax=Syngnathoides biaculeatus TaxID=300417 RepID=UPI002ADE43B8|nr:extracellular matrix protein 1 isoform X1 [Syngnathoides biaculeatus]